MHTLFVEGGIERGLPVGVFETYPFLEDEV